MEKQSSNIGWGIAFFTEIIIIVVLIVVTGKLYVHNRYSLLQVETLEESDTSVNDGANAAVSNYTNIALFGLDARDDSYGVGYHSDTIMIASINNTTNEVKIVSIYRDTMLQVSDVVTKVNSAYSYGGGALAVKTLNENLDLNVSEFITLNWVGMTRAIDALGGITVSITDEELELLNHNLREQIKTTGMSSDGVSHSGEVTLNGAQALAYARIVKNDRGDITRVERQQTVISKMIEKLRASSLTDIDEMIEELFPYISTSISEDQMIGLAENLQDYELVDVSSFPYIYDFCTDDDNGTCIAPADLTQNVTLLHLFLFETEGYTPSDTVQNLSRTISKHTGVYALKQD